MAAVVVVVSGVVVTLMIDNRELEAEPPQVTGTVVVQAVRNTDPRLQQFLADARRTESGWAANPGTLVEARVSWQLPRRIDTAACQVAVALLPEAPMPLGETSTGTDGSVGMGDDSILKKAFDEPGPANQLDGRFYTIRPTATDGTITIVTAYLDEQKPPFDASAVHASAVVECDNSDFLFHKDRSVGGPVTTLPVSVP